MKKLCLPVFLIASLFTSSGSFAQTSKQDPIHQLRIYEIFKNNKQAFHERFRDHAARIMKNYGFNIVSIWESENTERTEFYLFAGMAK